MRSDWKFVKLEILISIVIFLTSNCVTMYKVRSPEEIEDLNEEIVPLPESLLTIPEFDGKDTVPIFYFEMHGYWRPWTAHMLYNDGKLEFLQKHKGRRGVFLSGYIDVSDVQNFIFELNHRGFFTISNESIKKKKYIEYRGCCMGLFFGGLPIQPVRTDMTTHTIEVELTGFKHTISYYDIGYAAENYPTLEDLQVLKESINIIEDFLTAKRLEIY